MQKFFNVQRMLWLAEFRYYSMSGICAQLFVCQQCLPIVVSQGIDFQEQCGENLLTGHVFVTNDLMQDHTFQPRLFPHSCVNCNHPNTMCWRLDLSLDYLEYVSDRDHASKQVEWGGDVWVDVLGKRGRIVQQTGYSLLRPWIAIYTVQFEDGTRMELKRWQFRVLKGQS